MHIAPFGQPGRFYRGNLHTHSNRSDGALPPQAVAAAYREHGYDFLVISDHFLQAFGFPITDVRAFDTPKFITILGAELHAPRLASGALWHMLAVGLPADFSPPTEDETGPALAARAVAAGAFVGIAHPAWYTLTPEDALLVEAAHAIEVYNENCFLHNDRGDSWYLCDLLLAGGRRLYAYAADDAHFLGGRPDAFGGWVKVRAGELTPADVLAALRAGHFYSSQGPDIHDIVIEGNQIAIVCSPCQAVFVTGAQSQACSLRGTDVTEASFSLAEFAHLYCRVTVIDAQGKRAWSNPIWLD
jgi:hypothetical protein